MKRKYCDITCCDCEQINTVNKKDARGRVYCVGCGRILDTTKKHPHIKVKKHKCKQPKETYIERIRKSKKYNDLRKYVMLRANGRCEYCGKYTKELVMHHTEMVSKKPNLILKNTNVFGICKICHAEIHPWLRKEVS